MVSLAERTIKKMATLLTNLNITWLSEYRRDANTTIYTSRQPKPLTIEQTEEPIRNADCRHYIVEATISLDRSLVQLPTV
ncbi:hypothetical protein MUK42_05778 [Musa troglodytarum]|uniref:Uncharacterized protein n=1 Tax=Musa troglodytarum TaxID=320322 RepID=A0A9E7GMB4_9LILI|nr:hypothetical protein MUK42_05778 [Musa troglodytarum]